ncbi:MAG: hypothetical protein QF819_05520 [Gemmatimonadota bacterium]|jgi:hypothetical protein|nr:hypothetical protein [Gemmatimonadota bacterium]MDP6802621.1 hypothetical protein [Gemmatimonadota bacterium]MDP7030746.1 hypothetical protein [Gemmatimonadota bacterium]
MRLATLLSLAVFCAGTVSCTGSGESSDPRALFVRTLAPETITLVDLGFLCPQSLEEPVGKKNRAYLRFAWGQALVAYQGGRPEEVDGHLEEARGYFEQVGEQDPYWPERFRNLRAAALYNLGRGDEIGKSLGEMADPNPEEMLDIQYSWVLACQDLRKGREEAARARLAVVKTTDRSIGRLAEAVLGRLDGTGTLEGTEGAALPATE